MASVFHFFVTFSPLIYILLAIGLLFALRHLARARREARESIYGLEKELSQRHMGQAITALGLIVILALGELFLTAFLVPNLPAIFRLASPTTSEIFTPTGTLSPAILSTLAASTPVAASPLASNGCIPGQIAITAPKPGDQIRGQVTLTGSANAPNFGFFKYEFAPRGTESWSTIQAKSSIVQDGTLGTWDVSSLATGDYSLRLVITDNQGNSLPACVIPVSVVSP